MRREETDTPNLDADCGGAIVPEDESQVRRNTLDEIRDTYLVGHFMVKPTLIQPPRGQQYAARDYDPRHAERIYESMCRATMEGQCVIAWVYTSRVSAHQRKYLNVHSIYAVLTLPVFFGFCLVVRDWTAKDQDDWVQNMARHHNLISVTGNHFCHASRMYYHDHKREDPDKERPCPTWVYVSQSTIDPSK